MRFLIFKKEDFRCRILKTPKPKHQSSSKSRKCFLDHIILDLFSTRQRILSETFLTVNLAGKFNTCLNTYYFFYNFSGIQCTKNNEFCSVKGGKSF